MQRKEKREESRGKRAERRDKGQSQLEGGQRMKQDKKHHAPRKKKKVKKNEFCKGRYRLKKKTKLQMQDLLQILDWEFTQRMDKFEQQETAVVQKEQRGADRATEGGG